MEPLKEVTPDGEAAVKPENGMSSPFQLLPRYGVLVVGGLYTVGLLIVNLDLGRYGLISLTLARPEYIIAGALWAFLTFITWVASVVLVRNVKYLFASKRFASSLLRAFFELMISLGFCWWVFGIVSRNQIAPTEWKGWIVFMVVFANSLVVGFGFESYGGSFINGPISLRSFISAAEGKGSPIYFAVSLLLFLAFYSVLAFPQFPREFGGGKRPSIQVFLTEPQQIPWKEFQLPVSEDHKSIGPAALLLETDGMLVVTRLEEPFARAWYAMDPTSPAVAIDKRIVAAIAYKAGVR